jgi:hypothetical protein
MTKTASSLNVQFNVVIDTIPMSILALLAANRIGRCTGDAFGENVFTGRMVCNLQIILLGIAGRAFPAPEGIGRRTFYYVDITLNPHRKGCMPNASTILRRLWMESAPFPWWWFSARMAAASDGA